METLHTQRDLMTRDRVNALDTRKPDSGHKSISDPTKTARHLTPRVPKNGPAEPHFVVGPGGSLALSLIHI